ncbi:16135_t:CDS:2, partial [Rhizophagus irregularis]
GRSSECGFRWNELRMAFWMSFGKFKFRLSLEVEYAISGFLLKWNMRVGVWVGVWLRSYETTLTPFCFYF